MHDAITTVVGDSGYIDAARVIAVLSASLAFCLLGTILVQTRIRFVRGTVFLIMDALAYIATQEAQQIGKPFTVWRLPWLATIIVGSMVISTLWYRDRRKGGGEGRYISTTGRRAPIGETARPRQYDQIQGGAE